VVALLLQLTDRASCSTGALHDVLAHVHAIEAPGSSTALPTVDFAGLVHTVSTSDFYRYEGSLTTPPCTEGVSFLVAAAPLPLHVAPFNALKAVVKANSRFAQNTPGQENLLWRAADHLPAHI
jgi:carbonic anhydrase